MDCLSKNKARINCGQGIVSCLSNNGQKVEIEGRSWKNPLWVVKSSKIIKGLKKGLPIYVLKLKKLDQVEGGSEPEWLSEYLDIFLEELTNLPLEGELVHEIELIQGAQPITREPYKILPSKSLELK